MHLFDSGTSGATARRHVLEVEDDSYCGWRTRSVIECGCCRARAQRNIWTNGPRLRQEIFANELLVRESQNL